MSQTRRHILTVALRLFIQHGYREVTFGKLIEAAGVSKGSFYHYWPGKLALFREVVEEFFLSYFRGFSYADTELSFRELMDTTIRDFETMMDELRRMIGEDGTPFGYYLLLLEALRLFPELQETVAGEYERYTREITNLIRRAQERGEIGQRLSARTVAEILVPQTEGTALIAFMVRTPDVAASLRRHLEGIYTLLSPSESS